MAYAIGFFPWFFFTFSKGFTIYFTWDDGAGNFLVVGTKRENLGWMAEKYLHMYMHRAIEISLFSKACGVDPCALSILVFEFGNFHVTVKIRILCNVHV